MKKSLILIFLALCVCFPASTNAKADTIYSKTTESVISKGVNHTHSRLFTTSGWYNIHTLKINLNNEHLMLKTLTSPKGIGFRDTLPALTQNHNALAAVNADFFQPSSKDYTRSSPIGVVVDNGKVFSTPAKGNSMATIALNNEKLMSIDIWSHTTILKAPNGATKPIQHYNKYYDEESLVLLNRDWGEESLGSPTFHLEVVVENDIITDIRIEKPGVSLSENKYVIGATTEVSSFITDNFKIGDTVNLTTQISPDPKNFLMAVGGGTMLIKDGKAAPITHSIPGVHPRTAIGTDESGTIVYMVTVDGRQEASLGMDLDKLRDYLLDIGCYNAVNLDGGGSTTMVTKEIHENEVSIKNFPSEKQPRRVTNGIGVLSTAPKGAPAHLYIFFDETRFYVNGSYQIKINILDENYANLDYDQNDISIEVQGIDGYFENNLFYPKGNGNGKIIAKYKDLEGHFDLYIRPDEQIAENDNMKISSSHNTQGTKIAVLGNTYYNNPLEKLYITRMMDLAEKQADIMLFTGAVKDSTIKSAKVPVMYGSDYYATYEKENLIININNSQGGILDSDSGQWQNFINLLDNVESRNVIVSLSMPPDDRGFPSAMELNLFKELLEEKLIDKGKNVFIVYSDDETSVTIENGIRYFAIKGIGNLTSKRFTPLSKCNYLLITSNVNEVSYQIKSILEVENK